MRQFNLTLIVPTIGRRELLTNLFESIRLQSIRPKEIVVVNGGQASLEGLAGNYPDLSIRCIDSRPPSLTRQRNLGISAVSPGSDFVGFLDDDIVLEKGALEAMAAFWDKADKFVGGVSFNMVSKGFRPATLFERIFQVNAKERGIVLKSGFNSQLCSTEETRQVSWLMGGATIWRKSVVDEYKFNEWFAGYAHCEDVEYSYRVGKRYRLMVLKDARILHFSKPDADMQHEYHLGKMHVVNRIYFVALNHDLSLILCYWACLGLCINNIVKWIARLDIRYLKRAGGNIAGLFLSLAGKARPIKEVVKTCD
jgi:GT2 family glycosyltransferase